MIQPLEMEDAYGEGLRFTPFGPLHPAAKRTRGHRGLFLAVGDAASRTLSRVDAERIRDWLNEYLQDSEEP